MATASEEGIVLTQDAYDRMCATVRWAEAQMTGRGYAQPTNPILPVGVSVIILDTDAYPPGPGIHNAPITLPDGKKIYHGFFCRRDITATDPDQRWLLDTGQPCWVENLDGADLDPSLELFLVGFVVDTYDVTASADYDGGSFALVDVIGGIAKFGKGLKVSCIVQCDPVTGDLIHQNACMIIDKATGNLVLKNPDGSIVGTCDCDPPAS